MSTVDEYRKYARDCLRWASRALTEEQRKQFLSLARDWQQAASGLEGVKSRLSGSPRSRTRPRLTE
jgi:hypothetical protein